MSIYPDDQPLTTPRSRLATITTIDAAGDVWVADADQGVRRAHVVMHVSRIMLRTALRRHLPIIITEVDGSDQPIITGVLAEVPPLHARVEGEQVEITGERDVVLRCGKASITLTRAGQIVLRGEFIHSHSSGPQVIQGATVDIN